MVTLQIGLILLALALFVTLTAKIAAQEIEDERKWKV